MVKLENGPTQLSIVSLPDVRPLEMAMTPGDLGVTPARAASVMLTTDVAAPESSTACIARPLS